MAMRKSTARELNKARELLHYLLPMHVCYFCEKPLMPLHPAATPGDSKGPPLELRISIHHRDGNHSNNAQENLRLSHSACHRAHHCLENHVNGKF